MQEKLLPIVVRTVDSYRRIFGDALVQVILYGSYARGDYDNESDIDIVALVNCDRATISDKAYEMASFASDLDIAYGIMVSPSAIPYDEFILYKSDLPYYAAIEREGVKLIA